MSGPKPSGRKVCSCGAEIQFITSAKSGKPIPVELKRTSVVTELGHVVSGYETHFAHCPDAKKHRKS